MKDKPYIYDEQLQRVSCFSYYHFLETLHLLQTKNSINVNKSAKLSYTLITEDERTFDYVDWYTMFPRLEEDFGVDIDPLKSFKSLDTFVLYLKKPLVLEDVSIDLESLSEGDTQLEDTPLISLDVDEDADESSPQVDWDFVDGLYDDSDKRTSKDNLEEYARGFDIELAKNKSFQNMVKDFQKAIG